MNVFEDLIGELKEENLIEETVFDVGGANRLSAAAAPEPAVPILLKNEVDAPASSELSNSESERYRKWAMEEVSSLQMVEHILSGIEREHMKTTPVLFDDLAVKKALHRFLQVSNEPSTDDHRQAESELRSEVETWFSSLAKRDSNISVANIRRFCENSRPVLSSQALMALARFYRNSLFTEPVRGKFDFVMTRLFSRETGEDQRKQLFGRAEMVGHIKTLYANWSSLDLFPEDHHADRIRTTVAGFDEFASEASKAEKFDTLIKSDFFNRIRVYKEQAGELFFTTGVTAAAIQCNVTIGNRFIELLRLEGDRNSIDSIEARYGYTYDTVISSAASKTLHLLEILKEERIGRVDPNDARTEESVQHKVPSHELNFERAPVDEEARFRLLSVNKWLVAVCLVMLLLAVGVYFWSENAVGSQGDIESAKTVEVPDPELQPHIQVARASSETLYAMVQPSWSAKSEDEQKELLRRAMVVADSLKLKRVNILNYKGRTIGFATAEKTEIYTP